MKLLRFGPAGRERPGIIDAEGRIRDLSSVVRDFDCAGVRVEAIEQLRSLDLSTLPLAEEGVRIGPCVAGTRNFIAVGLNYAEHAAEAGAPIPLEPILFNKAPSCICGPNDDVIVPKGSTRTDWEVELAVVIGRRASYVSEDEARSVIAGYCICNDVSEREFQLEGTGQWMKGKGCPNFGPIGPWLVTPDEIADPQALGMVLDVNGERMQDGSSATMIFHVPFLISYISRFMILEPGDIITTGTPSGVGMGRKPPMYLKPGDEIALSIEGLGSQRQKVVAA